VLDTFAATSGVLTGTGATTAVVDLVADAIASMESISGITPAAIVAHPTVVSSIRESKASTSVVYNVDILSTAPTMPHAVQVISTPATSIGTAWLASSTGVVIYRRGGVVVDVGFNADDYSKDLNTCAMRSGSSSPSLARRRSTSRRSPDFGRVGWFGAAPTEGPSEVITPLEPRWLNGRPASGHRAWDGPYSVAAPHNSDTLDPCFTSSRWEVDSPGLRRRDPIGRDFGRVQPVISPMPLTLFSPPSMLRLI
jgi:hypothetical protein